MKKCLVIVIHIKSHTKEPKYLNLVSLLTAWRNAQEVSKYMAYFSNRAEVRALLNHKWLILAVSEY